MNEIPYFLIEAFGDKPFTGNPAAVCLLSEKLSHTVMQKIATQFNLSETAFVVPQEGGYEIRWFTPLCEVSLCGHGTLAAAAALWEKGVAKTIQFFSKTQVFQCQKTERGVELEFPKYKALPVTEDVSAGIRSLFPEGISFFTYEKILLVEYSDPTEVISYEAKSTLFQSIPYLGIYITAKSQESRYDFVSRCFFPNEGIPEDPVTGSAHCLLGPFWSERLKKNEMTAFQASSRSGVLGVKVLENSVLLSGRARVFANGMLRLNAFLGER